MDFLTLKPKAFGIDISDLSLKIANLKRKGKFFDLACFGEEKIKPGIIKGGEIKDEKALSEIIKEAIKKVKGEKLKTKYVVASLPEEKAFLQVIQLPIMSEEDLKSAVIYEAENYIPLPIEEVYLDFQIVKPVFNHLDHLDILIAALPKKIVDDYLFCLKQTGLKPKALEIESLAIARALIKDEFSQSPILLIDLGATRTSFIIFSGHSLRFTSSISVSSQNLTEVISKTMRIGLAQAEKLKIEYGFQSKIKNKEVSTAITPSFTYLLEQIKKHIDYYKTHSFHEHLSLENKTLEKILLCGGGANIIGLTDFLSSELCISVEKANPFINILARPEEGTAQLSLDQSLSCATALGLALRGIKEL